MKLLIVLGFIALLPNSEQELHPGVFRKSRYQLHIKRHHKFEMKASDCTWNFYAKGDYYIEHDTIHFHAIKLTSRNKEDFNPQAVHQFNKLSRAVYLSPDKILNLCMVYNSEGKLSVLRQDTMSISK